MIRAKGAKHDTRTLVRRSAGIPHGKTIPFWEAIIEKLEHGHHERIRKDGECEPLFPHSLKVDYVKNRFDKLVSNRSAKLDELAKKKPSSSNPSDWKSGQGDNTDDSEESEDDGVDGEEKYHLECRDSLLDAYFAQIRSFAEGSAAEENDSVIVQRNGASKRKPSGQENEEQDEQIMEDAANGAKKMTKLPKLPKVTEAERAQSSAVEHTSRVGAGFEALAIAQKPDSVEVFSAKLSVGIQAASGAIAGVFQAWSDSQKASRTCVRPLGHEFSSIDGVQPPIVLCKHCGMRV